MDMQKQKSYFTSSFNLDYLHAISSSMGYEPRFSVVHDTLDSPNLNRQISVLDSRIGNFSGTHLDLIPLTQEDYRYYSSKLETVLAMMDRQDPKNFIHTGKRIALFWKLIQCWEALFRQHDPSFLISRNIPHFASEYILYLVFRRYDRPFFMPSFCEHIKRMQLLTDLQTRHLKIPAKFLADPETQNISANILDRLSNQNYTGVQTTYQNIHQLKERSLVYRIQVRLRLIAFGLYKPFSKSTHAIVLSKNYNRQPLRFQVGWEFFKNTFILNKLYHEYHRRCIWDDASLVGKKILFFPLHYQPERTSLPDAIPFHDQLRAIDVLSRALPSNWIILVKEHPTIFRFPYKVLLRGNYSRSKAYYDKINSYSNVRLVSINESTNSWMRKSEALATLTGSVSLEALSLGKKVILFGNTWYRSFPNTHYYQDPISLIDFLNEKPPLKEDDLEKLKQTLSFYLNHSFERLFFKSKEENDISKEVEIYLQEIQKFLNLSKN